MLSWILYEDEEVLAVHKPAGIAVQTARAGQADVVSELKNHLCHHLCRSRGGSGMDAGWQEPYLGIVHRLDQPVEGLLVFAKTRRSAAFLTEQLRKQGDEGDFCKQYYAVLCGVPGEREGRLEDWLCKQPVKNGRHTEYVAVIKEPNYKVRNTNERQEPSITVEEPKICRAVLEYRILQTREEQGLALADIRIHTGRFHQIRAQMAYAGTPILGDQKYGSEESKALARALGVRSTALCAYRLSFLHPVSRERMDFRVKPENPAFSSFSQL